MDPIFWLALSLFLVAISLTAVLVVAVPAIQEVGRAARSVEKLFDTLSRDLPPTLEAIRLTGLEISELTDDVTDSVKSAAKAAKQVEDSITEMRQQAQTAHTTTRSVLAGVRAAWKTFTRPGVSATPSRRQLPRSRTVHNLQPQEPTEPTSPDLGEPLNLPPRAPRLESMPLESISLEIPEEIEQ
jgi:uncharacterized protein YoxC